MPALDSATYNGLMPKGSRAASTVLLRGSWTTNAYMPTRRGRHAVPHSRYARSSTSVSPVVENAWPAFRSSSRSSR